MLHFLILGIMLGLPSGFAPGPLLALVISETFRHDMSSGIKVAIAPLLTDLPLLLVTFFILSELAAFHRVLGAISLVGGGVIFLMGIQGILSKKGDLAKEIKAPASLAKGMLANVLSPHPYLFWFSVGGPIMTRAAGHGMDALAGFICGFYVMLVGAKIAVAVLAGQSKSFLTGNGYIFVLRFFGLVLCGFSLILFRDGLRLIGVL